MHRLIHAQVTAGQFGVYDGAGATHSLPLRRVVAAIEVVAVKAELHEELFSIKRPAFHEFAAVLDFANEIRMAAGDRHLHKVAGHGFVGRGGEDAIAVEVLIGVQVLRRLCERRWRRYEVKAGCVTEQ